MATSSDPQQGGSAAGSLSRQLIVHTALTQIDRSGLPSLSMRSLAQTLGVEAMSLYRYVHGRDDLLEAVVDELVGDLPGRLDRDLAAHWQGFLQNLAHEIRSIAIEHPRAFPLVATRHPAAPWLRPPLRSIEVVDAFLDTLIRQGFTDEQAVDAYRSFTSFLLGLLLLESAVRGASTGREDGARNGPDDGADSDSDAAGLEAAPQVRRLRPLLSEDRGDAEFEASLEDLLDRIGRGIAP